MSNDVDRARALYHYYHKKGDLLSLCKAEIVYQQKEELKRINKDIRYEVRVQKFLTSHPEYSSRFKRT